MDSRVAVPTRSGFEFMYIKDILYFESEGNYSNMYTIHGEKIFLSVMLAKLEKNFSAISFIRIHNRFLIHLNHVVRYEKGQGGLVILLNGIKLPVSREKKKYFLNKVTIAF
jgi:two-component system LytT family response regulator